MSDQQAEYTTGQQSAVTSGYIVNSGYEIQQKFQSLNVGDIFIIMHGNSSSAEETWSSHQMEKKQWMT